MEGYLIEIAQTVPLMRKDIRNLAFVTNYGFLISLSSQPNALDLRYFKLGINIGIRKS